MIKVRKAYVLVIAGLLASLFVLSASAAFGFSSPITTIVAGPGLATAGPTSFNTYSNDATLASANTAVDAGFSPIPGVLPGIPFGCAPFGCVPFASPSALTTANAADSNTFATSFNTAGAAGLGLGAAHFAGQFPEFALNFF